MELSGDFEFNHLTETISACDDCHTLSCNKKAVGGIPDWCPRLLEQITYVEDCVINHPEVKRRFKILENLSSTYNYGIEHAISVAKIGEQLLMCDNIEYQGKNIKLLYISAILHELGRTYDCINWDNNYWHNSAIIAEQILSPIRELSTYDKYRIIEAIDRHAIGVSHDRPISAALYFGSKLSFISNHFKNNMSIEEFEQLPEFDKQAFFTRNITFRTEEKDKNPVGILTLHYNQKTGRAYGFAPDFRPELFADYYNLIRGPREVAMGFLGLKDFEIHLSYKSPFYSSDKAPEVTVIPLEDFAGK